MIDGLSRQSCNVAVSICYLIAMYRVGLEVLRPWLQHLHRAWPEMYAGPTPGRPGIPVIQALKSHLPEANLTCLERQGAARTPETGRRSYGTRRDASVEQSNGQDSPGRRRHEPDEPGDEEIVSGGTRSYLGPPRNKRHQRVDETHGPRRDIPDQ